MFSSATYSNLGPNAPERIHLQRFRTNKEAFCTTHDHYPRGRYPQMPFVLYGAIVKVKSGRYSIIFTDFIKSPVAPDTTGYDS